MNRFVIADPRKCIGCRTCEAGCVSVHEPVGLMPYPRLFVMNTKPGTMPVQCHHCDDAPCAKVCPVHAITIASREVQLNERACIGCQMCALECPFGAITPRGSLGPLADLRDVDPVVPRSADTLPSQEPLHLPWMIGPRTVAVKCDLCHFRPEGPECIRVCPTKALRLVDDTEMEDINAERRTAAVAAAMGGNTFAHHRV